MTVYNPTVPHLIANPALHPPVLFCPSCGAPTTTRIPATEDRLRFVCTVCGLVHYQNPRIVSCALATHADGKILLARRDIEPRRHLWTLPGGFLELGEGVEAGAHRECEEETHCKIRLLAPLSMISLPFAGQVHIFFTAELITFSNKPTSESSEVALFAPQAIPWNEIAFTPVIHTLRHFVDNPTGFLCGTLDNDKTLHQISPSVAVKRLADY